VDEPKPKRETIWLPIVLVMVAAWIVYVRFLGPGAPSDFSISGDKRPVDYNWTLQDLDGGSVSFSKYEGKAVFLNIWATWCPPCVAEMPSIARLADSPRLKGRNIEFVCVSIDDSIDAPRKYVADKNWPMTILHARELPGAFLTDGIPATFIIAPDGNLVSTTLGGFEWDAESVVGELEKLAAIPPKTTKPAEPETPES